MVSRPLANLSILTPTLGQMRRGQSIAASESVTSQALHLLGSRLRTSSLFSLAVLANLHI